MVISDLSNPFFTELAIGIERACQTADVIPFLANTAENVVRQAQVIRSMREHGAAGLIICPAIGTEPAELDALTAGLPVIFAMRWLKDARGSVVVPDNRQGARRATAHLFSLGHRRIAFLGGADGMIVREERLAGYRDALAEAGVGQDPALVVTSMPTRDAVRPLHRCWPCGTRQRPAFASTMSSRSEPSMPWPSAACGPASISASSASTTLLRRGR
jgi:LacI family transcriptional regulator